MKRVIVYGLAGGVLIALLKAIEYQHFVRAYPTEIYGGTSTIPFQRCLSWQGKARNNTPMLSLLKTSFRKEICPYCFELFRVRDTPFCCS